MICKHCLKDIPDKDLYLTTTDITKIINLKGEYLAECKVCKEKELRISYNLISPYLRKKRELV